MQDNEVTFKCGQKVSVEMLIGQVSRASMGASFRALELAKAVIENDKLRAEEILETPVLLIYPLILSREDGACEVPPYWCGAKLWTLSENRKYRSCSVQWYQHKLVPDIEGNLAEWARSMNWTEAVDSSSGE